jgi:hypothetical protein
LSPTGTFEGREVAEDLLLDLKRPELQIAAEKLDTADDEVDRPWVDVEADSDSEVDRDEGLEMSGR